MNFDVKRATEECVSAIKTWFETESAGAKGAVIGISGGKDSTVVAGLCKKALGKENVLGVLMPNGVQPDIDYSIKLVEHLDIPYKIVNIEDAYKGLFSAIEGQIGEDFNKDAKINISPRLRMTTLYAVGQSLNLRVVGTSNASEKYIGYTTKWGDNVCDFHPIASFNTEEVIEIGRYLGIPDELVYKAPTDGISGFTDEEKIGFKYKELNEYMSTGVCENTETKEKIDRMHSISHHKRNAIPSFEYNR